MADASWNLPGSPASSLLVHVCGRYRCGKGYVCVCVLVSVDVGEGRVCVCAHAHVSDFFFFYISIYQMPNERL